MLLENEVYDKGAFTVPWLSKGTLMSVRAKPSPFCADRTSETSSFGKVVVLCLKIKAEAGHAFKEKEVHVNELHLQHLNDTSCDTVNTLRSVCE